MLHFVKTKPDTPHNVLFKALNMVQVTIQDMINKTREYNHCYDHCSLTRAVIPF